ncbi:MAG: hypothetical protein ACK559_19190 [bacterium]
MGRAAADNGLVGREVDRLRAGVQGQARHCHHHLAHRVARGCAAHDGGVVPE